MPAFLQLRNFKSRLRPAAKIQHMKISNDAAVQIISNIYYNYQPVQSLFSDSSAKFFG